MVVTLAGGCRVSEMHDGEPVVEGTLSIWNRIGRATGTQAISLRVMEFAPGKSPTIINDDCDQILYLVDEVRTSCGSGRATVWIGGRSHEITLDTGVYIRPNQTFAIENPGPGSFVIISAQCPDPDHAPRFADRPLASSDSCQPAQAPIVRLADQKAQPTADRWYRVLIDERVGSDQVTQFVGSIPPGRAPDHFHNYEEVLFILKGEGRMWAGESNTPITAGSCIYLPKGQVHCVENTGDGELRLLGVFYPAGSPSVRYDV
jgi:mannose-6-phosphate isomerase-like protein (cupin superfamily)